MRAAVNLAGCACGTWAGGHLAAPGALALTDRTDVSLGVLPDAPFPVHTGSQLHFHHGARAWCAAASSWDRTCSAPARGWAQLRFTQPVAAAPGDRFVARFFSPLALVGGGVLVDLSPPAGPHAAGAAGPAGRPGGGAAPWRQNPPPPRRLGGPRPVGGGGRGAGGPLSGIRPGAAPWARVEPRFAGRIREARRACRRLKERGVLLELSPAICSTPGPSGWRRPGCAGASAPPPSPWHRPGTPWVVPAGAPCSCWSTGTPPASPAGRERADFFPSA